MKVKTHNTTLFLIIHLFCFHTLVLAQGIETESGQSVQFLLEEILLGDHCANISNLQVRGNASLSIGSFSNGSSSIGMASGVIFSTGNLHDAQGPNDSASTGIFFNNPDNSDADLDLLTPAGTYNTTGISFDFTPTTDSISFRYVFASEEYCEFVGSIYNDVFGFFISGPGFDGPFADNAENIALIPGTNQAVAINSVNSQTNAAFYIDNVPIGQTPQISNGCTNTDLSSPAAAADEIEFDGFTTVLTASARVQPCETYHIRLLVADVGDPIFDSAVFLEANSFNISEGITTYFSFPSLEEDGVVYEDCQNDGFITFERPPNADTSEAIIINFDVSPLSTATEGIDFSVLPDQVTIPAGESQLLLPISIFQDTITEGQESIILEVDNNCSCELTSIELKIEEVAGTATLSGSANICNNSLIGDLNVSFTGSGPWSITYSIDGVLQAPIDNITSNPFVLPVEEAGLFALENFTTAFCNGVVAGSALVTTSSINATLSANPTSCFDSHDGSIDLTVNASNSYNLVWNNDSTNENLSDLAPAIYSVNINDEYGCTYTDSIEVVTPDSIRVTLLAISPVTCIDSMSGSATISASGGTAPFNYSWDNGTNSSQADHLTAGLHTVSITDANLCSTVFDIFITEDLEQPIAVTHVTDTLNCLVTTVLLDGSGSSGNAPISFQWLDADNNVLSEDSVCSTNSAGLYTLIVSNTENHCIDQQSVMVEQDTSAPLAIITPLLPNVLNCFIDSVHLDASNSSPFNALSFEWSTLDGNILSNTNSDLIAVGAAATYELIVTNQHNHCMDSTSYLVNEDIVTPSIFITPPHELTCSITTVNINAINTSEAGEFIYSWSADNGLNLEHEEGLEISIDQAGTYQLNAQNILNGCSSSSEVTVIQDTIAPLAVAHVNDNLDCVTSSVPLSGMGSSVGTHIQYTWDGPAILSGHNTLMPIVEQAGVYTLTVTNTDNDCFQTANTTVTLNSNTPIDLAFSVSPPPCPEDTGSIEVAAVIGGEAPYLFSIDGGQTFNNNNFFHTLQPGIYDIIVQDVIGCEYEESVFIPQAQEVAVQLGVDLHLELGDEEQLNGISNLPNDQIASIIWSPSTGLSCTDCFNPFVSPLESTTYMLTIVSNNGCVASDKLSIFVKKDRNIYIPNAFSPDLDGVNDIFYIFSDRKSVKNIRSFQIFNRWGGLVFEDFNFMPDNPAHGWNGKFNGLTLNPATFVYVAEIEFIDGSVVVFAGDVNLVR